VRQKTYLTISFPHYFTTHGLVEKLRCTLPLSNLFPSLARRFACCQSCFVSLRTLWAYGFDSATRRAPEKSKVDEKEKYFIPFNMADMIPKNHILRLINKLGLSPEFLKAF